MADLKISELTNLTAADPVSDMLPIVDVSATPPASGSTKRISINNLLSSSPTASGALTVTGLVTAGSATITGTLTIGGATSFPASVINTSGGNPVFTPTAATLFLYSGSSFLSIRNQANTQEIFNLTPAGVYTFGDGSGSTRMTLNSTGLGVGVASPSAKLHISGNFKIDGATSEILMATGSERTISASGSSASTALTFKRWNSSSYVSDVVMDGSGNVGVGVTPSAWRNTQRALQIGGAGCLFSSTATTGSTSFGRNVYESTAGNYTYIANDEATLYEQGADGKHYWYTAVAGTGTIAFVQAMTLDASGNLMVGQATVTGANADSFVYSKSGAYATLSHVSGTSSGTAYLQFLYNNTQIGTITQNGTTGVLYNIVSDYRLKESVKPLNGGLARVNALKPSSYNWKSDGSAGEGFLAHELAEVVPFAVSGEKDAMNADGTIKSQGIDMSRVVPILVAAIQELTAEVNALKNA